jgi:hypothetical protein
MLDADVWYADADVCYADAGDAVYYRYDSVSSAGRVVYIVGLALSRCAWRGGRRSETLNPKP